MVDVLEYAQRVVRLRGERPFAKVQLCLNLRRLRQSFRELCLVAKPCEMPKEGEKHLIDIPCRSPYCCECFGTHDTPDDPLLGCTHSLPDHPPVDDAHLRRLTDRKLTPLTHYGMCEGANTGSARPREERGSLRHRRRTRYFVRRLRRPVRPETRFAASATR